MPRLARLSEHFQTPPIIQPAPPRREIIFLSSAPVAFPRLAVPSLHRTTWRTPQTSSADSCTSLSTAHTSPWRAWPFRICCITFSSLFHWVWPPTFYTHSTLNSGTGGIASEFFLYELRSVDLIIWLLLLRNLRRRHGIPDHDRRPFTVAFAAAKGAHLKRDSKESTPSSLNNVASSGSQTALQRHIPRQRQNAGEYLPASNDMRRPHSGS